MCIQNTIRGASDTWSREEVAGFAWERRIEGSMITAWQTRNIT